MKQSKQRDFLEVCIDVLRAEQESLTGKRSLTTSNRLFGQAEIDKLLENSPPDSTPPSADGRSSAPTATGQSPSEKTLQGEVVTRLFERVPGSYAAKAAKLRPSLLPIEATIEGTKAMEFGASKYGANAWREVEMSKEDFLNALERHVIAIRQGETHAADSGVNHLGHIIANCAIILAKFPEDK
jgi:hypothetical protein